jgi:hypothetical protein
MTGRRRRGAGATSLLLIGAAALVAGCSVSFGAGGLDEPKLANAIRDRIEQLTGVAPESVTCPSRAKQGKGNDFTCTAMLEGQPVTVKVSQPDDSGHVRFAAVEALVRRADVEHFIQTDAKKGPYQVSVTCGTTTVVVAKVGSTFSCALHTGSASASGGGSGPGPGGGPQTATVTAQSADGRFSVRYPRPGTAASATSTNTPTSQSAGSSAAGSAS